MAVGGQSQAPAALPPGNCPGTNCTGGYVGPRARLGRCREQKIPWLHRCSNTEPSSK